MSIQAVWLVLLAAGLAVVVLAVRLATVWARNRGERAITCPENQQAAGVRVNERHAAWTGLSGSPELRLSACTRWPERAGCGQQCLAQIAAAPDGCLVRNILAEWYRGKKCAHCGQEFTEVEWAVQKPALLSANKISMEWSQVPADRLRETLETALPVCFACHMANTLVREHPDLVADRGALEGRRIS